MVFYIVPEDYVKAEPTEVENFIGWFERLYEAVIFALNN